MAVAAGVAVSTASMALRCDPRIAPATQRRVADAAARVGYVRHPFLSLLGRRRGRGEAPPDQIPVALLHGPNVHNYYAEMPDIAARHGLMLTPMRAGDVTGRAGSRTLRARGVVGILLGRGCDRVDFGDFEWAHFVVIQFGIEEVLPGGPRLRVAVFEPVLRLYRKMRERGYNRIGMLLRIHDPVQIDDDRRIGAFLAAQRLEPARRRLPIRTHRFNATFPQDAVRAYVQSHRPDAVIVFDSFSLTRIRDAIGQPLAGAALVLAGDSERWCAGWWMPNRSLIEMTMEFMVEQIRAGRTGLLATEFVHQIHPEWNEGNSLPEKGSVSNS